MKTINRLLILVSILWGASARAQVVLQDFSTTTGPNTFFYGTWEATGDAGGTINPNLNFSQGSGVYSFTGTSGIVPTNSAGSKVEFFNATPVSIGANTFLSVGAQSLAANLASSFTVILVDTAGATAFSTFSTSDFATGSYSTITVPLTFGFGFDATSIDSMIFSGNQPGGTDRFNMSFDNISADSGVPAVPEPGTSAALLGISAFGFVGWRRRWRQCES